MYKVSLLPKLCAQSWSHTLLGSFWRQYSAAVLQGQEDRFQGVTVNLGEAEGNLSQQEFDALLKESLAEWKTTNHTAVWLNVPIQQSNLITTAARHGFTFHHAEGTTATLCQWLQPNLINKVPIFATHQIGVAGCVIQAEERKILIVQEKNRAFSLWKFPGGLSELGEDIGQTAEREVYEETGIKSEFQGILAFRQQHNQPGAFGRSDLYFLCHMNPSNYDLHPCSIEIAQCKWMDIDELSHHEDTSPITLETLKLIKKGLRSGFSQIHLAPKSFKSIYKGLHYKMYRRSVDDNIES